MTTRRRYRVNEVARITGISVRALHHYDQIGLLVPAARSRAGYRLYEDADLVRLQQVLIGRELGLSLEAIKQALDDPTFDRKAVLRRQLEQLTKRAQQTAEMIAAVERAITLLEREKATDEMDMSKLFDGFDPPKHEAEARERWGETAAYRESARRTSHYTSVDWQRLGAEQAALYSDIAAAIQAGIELTSSEGIALAERHRASIDRWFYPCSIRMHTGLADMYENDQRFADDMDKFGVGLTAFLVQAFRANAESPASDLPLLK